MKELIAIADLETLRVNNMRNVEPFKFESTEIRTIVEEDQIWVVAKDVAEALGYKWAGSATISHVPEQWKGVNSVLTPSGAQEMTVLSEPGLYFFLGRSDKPKALPFQVWLAGEVVPSIRKTGSYSALKVSDPEAAALIKALVLALVLADQAKQEAQQAKQLATQANERLDQIETGIDHFTVIGYSRAFLKKALPLAEAAKFGKRATTICNSMGIAMGTVPDPRFGSVNTYPKAILDEVCHEETNTKNVRLVAITTPTVPECASAGDLVAYCGRVSNPNNQANKETAPKLLKYLIKNQHWSPFEMAHVVLEINTTRDISRQILRHRSFSFAEFSQRYAPAQGFVSRECRMQDTTNRQNSLPSEDKWVDIAFFVSQKITVAVCNTLYRLMLSLGVAKEQARAVLPEGLTTTRLYVAGSLRSWIHYCQLRCGNGTQKEHAEIAKECWSIIVHEFPALRTCAGYPSTTEDTMLELM